MADDDPDQDTGSEPESEPESDPESDPDLDARSWSDPDSKAASNAGDETGPDDPAPPGYETGSDGSWDDTADASGGSGDLPGDVVERAERLTRRALEAVDENERAAYRRERDALLADHGEDGYLARVREDDTGATLVLYPARWLDDDVVDVERVEDTARAVERSLSGSDSGDDWAAVEAHNRAVADRVQDVHGEVHGETAHAFADFMSNHYAKRIERATPRERAEFREEYLPRNAWPSAAQLDRLERSLALVVETAESL